MPRVIGIDPGTVAIDVCGLADGRVFLDRSFPTGEALADPHGFVATLEADGLVDLVAGPSGYGLPVTRARDATDEQLRLAYLAVEGEPGGIGGLRSLARVLARSTLPVVFTPGVVHLASVPSHRKINRVDMGTADKVCAAALAVWEQARRRGCAEREVSLVLLELGGAFTAAIAVERGAIVDGVGGTSGPIGMRSAGALDGEVAYLAGALTKHTLFSGGARDVAGLADAAPEELFAATTGRGAQAWEALAEGAVKAVAALRVAVPNATEVVLSGRLARAERVREELGRRLAAAGIALPVHALSGFAPVSKQAAQGAALIADGLAGGAEAALVRAMGIEHARGTVLDHVYVVSPTAARRRLGLVPT